MAASGEGRVAAQPDLSWVLQSQQLGTGHAVLQAIPSIPDDHQVVVAFGDVPLVSTRTLQRLVKDSADGDLALSTAVVEDPSGYGRMIRDARGDVERIVEDKDATDEERRVERGQHRPHGVRRGTASGAARQLATTTRRASTT